MPKNLEKVSCNSVKAEKKVTSLLPSWDEFVSISKNESSQKRNRIESNYSVYHSYSKTC